MVINKYTFFSLNGNDFPITSNSDGQLYQMLTGMKDGDYRIKDSTPPLNTALNRVYTNTSMVVGGRYFELKDHSITLKPAQTNFIHAVINIANFDNPVTITVEDQNNSNKADINNTSNVLKVCFEIIVTSAIAVTGVTRTAQNTNIDNLNVSGKVSDLGMSNFTPRTTTWSSNGVNIAFTRVGPLVIGVWGGSQSNVAQGFTYTTPVPSGFRPNTQAKLLVVQSAVSNINIDTNGTVKYWGVPATNGNLSGTLTYFTNDPFPA